MSCADEDLHRRRFANKTLRTKILCRRKYALTKMMHRRRFATKICVDEDLWTNIHGRRFTDEDCDRGRIFADKIIRGRRFADKDMRTNKCVDEYLRTNICADEDLRRRRFADEDLRTKICGRRFADEDLRTKICETKICVDEYLRYE